MVISSRKQVGKGYNTKPEYLKIEKKVRKRAEMA